MVTTHDSIRTVRQLVSTLYDAANELRDGNVRDAALQAIADGNKFLVDAGHEPIDNPHGDS